MRKTMKNKKRKSKQYPKRYVPKGLSKKDRVKQVREIEKSKSQYKNGNYHMRDKVKSFKNRPSKHIQNAYSMYDIDTMKINSSLAKKTGCSVKGLKEIYRKGQGAYYSSGSRPNQTADSWAHARVASSITGGKSSSVDFHILDAHCKKSSKALRLAKDMRKTHKNGRKRVAKILV